MHGELKIRDDAFNIPATYKIILNNTTHIGRPTLPMNNPFDIETTNQEEQRYNLRQPNTIKTRDSHIDSVTCSH